MTSEQPRRRIDRSCWQALAFALVGLGMSAALLAWEPLYLLACGVFVLVFVLPMQLAFRSMISAGAKRRATDAAFMPRSRWLMLEIGVPVSVLLGLAAALAALLHVISVRTEAPFDGGAVLVALAAAGSLSLAFSLASGCDRSTG
jgi:hypothetical protein